MLPPAVAAGRHDRRAHLRAVPEPEGAARAARAPSSPAASSRCWRSPASCAPAPSCCCSTSRPRGWPRSSCSRSARTIRELKREGFTILLVEQNFRFASTLADRHYVVEHGRVVDMIPNDELERQHGQAARVSGRLKEVGREGDDAMRLGAGAARRRRRSRCRRGAGAFTGDTVQDRRAERHVRPLRRHRRPGLGAGGPAWRSRISAATVKGIDRRGRLRRPPEQARRRRQHRPAMVRRRRRRRDRRRADNSAVALAVNDVAREKNKVFLDLRRRRPPTSPARSARPTRVHWTYDTWMLAHGTGGAMVKAGRRQLVLHHRRLRLRPCARARHRRVVKAQRRQGAGHGPAPAQHTGLLLLPAAGAGVEGARSSASPMPAATRSTRSSRRPSSASCRAGSSSPALLMFITDVHALGLQRRRAWCSPSAFYWDLNDAAPAPSPSASRRKTTAAMPTMVACRRLRGRAALPEGGARRSKQRRRRRGVVAKMKEHADRRPALRQGHASAPTAARSTTCTCSR